MTCKWQLNGSHQTLQPQKFWRMTMLFAQIPLNLKAVLITEPYSLPSHRELYLIWVFDIWEQFGKPHKERLDPFYLFID